MTLARYQVATLALLALLTLTPVINAQEAGDYDWVPDRYVEYVVEWPISGEWGIAGRSTYKLVVQEEKENIVVDFEITYEADQVANLTIIVTNQMIIGALEERFRGWVSNFDFIATPKVDGQDMGPANFPPFNGTGYATLKQLDVGDKIKITGKLKLVNDRTRDLKKLGLTYLDAYPNVYIVLADMLIDNESGDILVPNMFSWGSIVVPLSKNDLDTLKLITERDEKIKELNDRIQELNTILNNTREELENVRASFEPLQKENDNLKNLLEQRDKEIVSVRIRLSETENLLYLSFGLFAILMVALMVVALIVFRR